MEEENLKQIGKYVVDTGKKLGQGSFGIVYLGYKIKKPNIPLAVKILEMDLFSKNEEYQTNQENLRREINILTSICSPYIVDMKEIFRTENHIYMFLRYANSGDLERKLKQIPSHRFNEDVGMRYFAQLVEGYKALHANNIIHRDIKPANVLIDNDIALLSDFGLGKITSIQADKRQEITAIGTPYYRSPQLLTEDSKVIATNKCDVWSMGILLYEILNGKRPWNGTNIKSYYQAVINKPLMFMVELSQEVQDLIRGMLAIEEKDRLSWEQVFTHPAILKQNIPENPY
ncbi:Protein kinase-like domain [Pseudocohnilembus persalinus]|uniref:Protein kinase-like domain n=1 Tax=Pseudocohnilembus persalinus TaxID=266149 RepID=A0A0V0RA34_PSEPJ|nr:Protein kinase-like domain [Pseudocohnilembus persalinus]|eukprot:KRX11080.1 Protein kinase-like domain [Pseudocohnilembus persalinus]